MAVVFDLLARVLRLQFPQVTYASNITDIDDKIMAAARKQVSPLITSPDISAVYNADMAALGVSLPDVQPRATGNHP